MKIGFIGLGIMGTPMAGHLLAAGHTLFVRTRSQVPAALSAATVCATNADVARSADIVFLMLPDTPDVETVLFAPDGVADGLSAGKVVVDMSSISPMETKRFAESVNALGCDYLDAPVSGGDVGARPALTGSSPCWSSWAKTSPWWVATATARPPRSPTRSSSRSTSPPWARPWCSPARPAPTRPRCARP